MSTVCIWFYFVHQKPHFNFMRALWAGSLAETRPSCSQLQQRSSESGDSACCITPRTPRADCEVGLGTSSCSWFSLLPGLRYAIDRSTDTERIFDIDANTGAIVTGKVLDRETAGWHNITVLAMEAGEMEERRAEQTVCTGLYQGQREKYRHFHCKGDQGATVN